VTSTTVCAYCGTENSQDEHRCSRCARRMQAGPVRAGQGGEIMLERTLGVKSLAPPQAENRRPTALGQNLYDSSAARQPQLYEVPAQSRVEQPQPEAPAQGVLFTAHEVRGGEQFRSKIVALDDFRQPAPRARRRPSGRALPPRDAEAQRTLFSELGDTVVAPAPAPIMDSGLHSAALVAPLVQRATATVLDAVMVCLAEGLMLAGLYMSPAASFISSNTLPGLAVFGLFLAIGYKLIFAMAETDSPGTRWAHLKVLNFDGGAPTRNERLARLAGGLLSTAASGLGLIWALVDEETLSWHDHISKTFASPNFGPMTGTRRKP
jgi:uncharacterized RDD family membrane protein YckC